MIHHLDFSFCAHFFLSFAEIVSLDSSTSILIVISLLFSIAIGYFQYYYKGKKLGKVRPYLFGLRTLAFFLLFLLLINPSIEKTELINEKPVLSVLVDNSSSIKYFQQDSLVNRAVSSWKTDSKLNSKFDINFYELGNDLTLLDSLDFSETQTNLSGPLRSINDLNKGKKNAVVLLSDGNQTLGNDYEFINMKSSIYPLVVGDTIKYKDISISQLNVNRYSFLNNQFPVEAILNYDGSGTANSRFTIENRGRVVYRKNIQFTPDNSSQTIDVNLKSETEGVNFYTAKLESISGEKNLSNNQKKFSVEVIDKQSQILILSSMNHPDLGAIKKSIERDQQRKATIKIIDEDFQINEFQLVVLYQPNLQFKDVFESIRSNKINYFLITGTKTDWNFLNNEGLGVQKNSIDSSEDYGAIYNGGYLLFSQKDIGFENLPPLKDKFGETRITIPHSVLLNQSISGLSMDESLLATSDENNHKKVFLLGEGIWKWRSTTYLNYNSFEEFDSFIGNLIQYAASKKVRDRLDLDINSIYNANEIIKIGAFYVDSNFEFDPRATLILELTNTNTNQTKSYPFSLTNNSYQLSLEALNSGIYEYKVNVEGQDISKSGSFQITEFSVEEQFTNANKEKLQRLAERTGGKSYYINNNDGLIQELINSKEYVTIQRSSISKESIINWIWILFLLTGLLAIEWFVRKYHGKI